MNCSRRLWLAAWVYCVFLTTGAVAAPIEIPGTRAFPESLSADSGGTLYIGRAGEGGVVRRRPGSSGEVWIAPGAFGSRSILGVLVDAGAGVLWVCSNDLSPAGVPSPGTGRTALKGFDLDTGQGRISAELPTGKDSYCSDIAVSPDGGVYVGDVSGRVLKLNQDGRSFQVWAQDARLYDLDGIAFGADGALYVNTSSSGLLFRVSVRGSSAGKVTELHLSRRLVGPDGMRAQADGTFLMAENAGRLDEITIRGDSARVRTIQDGLREPSAVARIGTTAWVTEAQMSALFEPKKAAPVVLPFRVVPVALTPSSAPCPGDNGGLTLSPGFCATVFADHLGHARHLVVAPNGVVYVNTWSGSYYSFHGGKVPAGGFLIALKDHKKEGRADSIERFGPSAEQGATGGTGIVFYRGALYAEMNDRIARYALRPDSLLPVGNPQVVVSGLPMTGEHPMHPFVIDSRGNLFVDIGSRSNACQPEGETAPRTVPPACEELAGRGGIWRYDANKTAQVFSPVERYATGIRNGEGMDFDAAGKLYVSQHGRDQLAENWPQYFTPQRGRELPAEEVFILEEGADYGWPECYFDGFQRKQVLAPEYGGDGGRRVGGCQGKKAPVAFFPAHFAPNDLLIYKGGQFPAPYQGGAFIAFHGSWNRAPGPQGGYNVIYQPLADGHVSGPYVVFADGFAGAFKEPGRASFRPSGLAVGPDGALYISEDVQGRVWRITYRGEGVDHVLSAPAPVATSLATAVIDVSKLPTPPGASSGQVVRGYRIFRGELAGGTCSGCHGSDAAGSTVGPDLTRGTWLWSDGSWRAIAATINRGVPVPKESDAIMPPKGGAPLSASDIDAVAAFVWAVGHRGVAN